MSFSIVLRSDAGIPRAGSLELKIAYALGKQRGPTSPFHVLCPHSVSSGGLQASQI